MSQHPVTIAVDLSAQDAAALDAWIARAAEPRPTRAEAMVQLVRGVLGSQTPSTMIPGIVTGRDIV